MPAVAHAQAKMWSPLKCHGGKGRLARKIIATFYPHRTYVEPFAFGASVLLNKGRSNLEVIADLSPAVVNFWRVLRDDPGSFRRTARLLEYGREAFDGAADLLDCEDDMFRALAFLVRCRMSQGGRGKVFSEPGKGRTRGGLPDSVNAWKTCLENLDDVRDRMRSVTILGPCDARQIIAYHQDDPEVLFYLDPPYLPETRATPNTYDFEMTADDHEALLRLALRCQGQVVISGYWSELYADLLRGWPSLAWERGNDSGPAPKAGKAKSRRIEFLWSNRPFPAKATRGATVLP